MPWEAENPLFPADFDKIAPWLEEAFNRVPVLGEVGIKRVVHGAITHTTDAHMLLGPGARAPQLLAQHRLVDRPRLGARRRPRTRSLDRPRRRPS